MASLTNDVVDALRDICENIPSRGFQNIMERQWRDIVSK